VLTKPGRAIAQIVMGHSPLTIAVVTADDLLIGIERAESPSQKRNLLLFC
jgi:hypothetical protein